MPDILVVQSCNEVSLVHGIAGTNIIVYRICAKTKVGLAAKLGIELRKKWARLRAKADLKSRLYWLIR